MRDKPGAVMIELPEDIAKENVNSKVLFPTGENFEAGVNLHEVDLALDLIAESKAPLLLVGGGCVRSHSDDELLTFVEKTNIYAADTFMGKGAVSAKHDRSLRCVGLGMKDIALRAFDKSDLIICVGYDMIEWPPDHWNAGHKKKIVHIDCLPAEVDENYLPELELIGDINCILRAINSRVSEKHKKDPNSFAKIRDAINEDLSAYDQDEEFPIKPQRMLSDLREVMRDDDILISDVGAHKMWVARQYPTYHSSTCFISNGFCSMGCAMPGAVAAKRLHPEKHVVALCGDGGFMMSIQALPTAVRYKIPITVLVWDDDAYGLIKWKQEMAYKKHSHIDLHNPDLVSLAQSFGCHAERIDSVAALKPAMLAALSRQDQPSVIIIPVDYRENMKLTKHLGEIICR